MILTSTPALTRAARWAPTSGSVRYSTWITSEVEAPSISCSSRAREFSGESTSGPAAGVKGTPSQSAAKTRKSSATSAGTWSMTTYSRLPVKPAFVKLQVMT